MRRAALAVAVLGAALVAVALATAGGGEPTGSTGPRAPAAAPAPPGLAVFQAQGCGSCHAFAPANANGAMAPDLTLFLDGDSEGQIRRSIVAPAAEAEPGWSGGTMPADYAERMTPGELDALVAFLAAG